MPRQRIELDPIDAISILDEEGRLDQALEPSIPPDDLRRLYRPFLLARRFDERMLLLQRQGRIGTYLPARGHEAVCVSHQLPIWIVRSFVERRRLWHDPRKRQCTLASLTSFTYQGDKIVSVGYTEPARDLVPAHLLAGAKPVKGKSKAFGA